MASMAHKLFRLSLFILVLGCCYAVWPRVLGGEATFAMVSGQSMVPTANDGDLYIARRQSEYTVGDIVVYEAPMGGMVAHRIANNTAKGLLLQGDANSWVDPWHVSQDEIQGLVWVRIPKGGFALSIAKQPLVISFLASTIAALRLVSRPGSKGRKSCSLG